MTGKLPSYLPSTMTSQLDAAYERGFLLGRAAGLETACGLLRAQKSSPIIQELIEALTREKYNHDATSL